mmetsp:Transcript_5439/g.7875  ORF Transcript_5439/g.7875 Transcript_5439/m.7875 type:complete len:157 (-) Transcript_5439:135-605(-)|eukprot:CAMPEP_0194242378 /NCGR_PEP_ID=MMETSP0158-20130606/7931_1 /TAXON_ID=33649 /ORGANISM="Thalassionema nitzschioides, Strain L26-B" /LENGTH=156 /DNA_ID=CAMNT_0038977449 /DNA_START=72 /DNA_END=542 /DNA_ORIENTATION=+
MILRRRAMLHRPSVVRNKWLLFALGACILGLFVVSHVISRIQGPPSFSLLVTLLFKKEQYKEEFLNDFVPLAKYVRQHEPTTIAYEVLQSDDDPLRIMILERYVDKEMAYLKVHKLSAAFLEFRPKLKAMQESGFVTIEGHSYRDSQLGFVGRQDG